MDKNNELKDGKYTYYLRKDKSAAFVVICEKGQITIGSSGTDNDKDTVSVSMRMPHRGSPTMKVQAHKIETYDLV